MEVASVALAGDTKELSMVVDTACTASLVGESTLDKFLRVYGYLVISYIDRSVTYRFANDEKVRTERAVVLKIAS